MSDKIQIQRLQDAIGYTFKDPTLLNIAFTHQSAADKSNPSNVFLVFLGKPVCELLIRDYLYSNYLSDSSIDPLAAEVGINSLIKNYCDSLKLCKYLNLSDSAEALRYSKVVESELFTALIGAIYKDGGMPAVKAFILPKLRSVIANEAPDFLSSNTGTDKRTVRSPKKERVPFSDNYTEIPEKPKSAAKSAADAIKSLFSPKKRAEKNKISANTDIAETKKETIATVSPEKSNIKKEKQELAISSHPHTSISRSEKNVTSRSNNTAVSDGNYKSALQEYVQKNIRSATVKLEYKDVKDMGGYITSIYLFDKKIAESKGATKKNSSQNAARIAYEAIMENNSDANRWFNTLRSDPHSVEDSNKTDFMDYVSKLNQISQKQHHRSDASVKYERVPGTNKHMISIAVIADDKKLAIGEGKNIKEAKQNAAKAALECLSKVK